MIPTATSNDGKAQHNKVDTEVNKDAMLTKSSFSFINFCMINS